MKRKEIYWFIGTMALVLLINFALFGSDGFKVVSTFDLNIHDTYFVTSHIYFLLLLFVLVLFGIYLVRVLYRNFKNLIANLVLMLTTLLLILITTGANSIVTFSMQQYIHPVNPPLSPVGIQPEINQVLTVFKVLSDTIYAIQIMMLMLLAYTGFRTGRNYKRRD